jgi:3-oxoacyl-(acyl-carrier-protein) synthase
MTSATTSRTRPGTLAVLGTARRPDPQVPVAPRPLPGFVASTFSPLVADVADRCLRGYHGEPPLPATAGDRTALVLASVRGDLAIAAEIARTVDGGHRMSPLLFFQSVATAVLGHIAARWGLAGPVVCVSPVGDPQADALALAAALIEDGDADAALVLVAEPAWTPGELDRASATLLGRPTSAVTEPADEGDRHGQL